MTWHSRVYPAVMLGTARHFAIGAGTSVAVGLPFAIYGAVVPDARPPLAGMHLVGVGFCLFLAGFFAVQRNPARLLPDPMLRRGPAPRAFWAMVVGLLAHAIAAPLASEKAPFWSALELGGALVEGAALLLLLAPLAVKLTPPGPSGTEGEPSGS